MGFISLGSAVLLKQLKAQNCYIHPTATSPQGFGDLLTHTQHKPHWDMVVKEEP